ncbi:MAG: hypothetical protein ACXAB2_13935 [Candidatus Hodarchaeales archaeon]
MTHHKRIAKIIDAQQGKGWSLHTYQTAVTGKEIYHYLLFEKPML